MEKLTIWKQTKIGFWIGIGFIIPSLIVYFIGTYLVIKITPFMYDSQEEKTEVEYDIKNYASDFDKSEQIKIVKFRETTTNNQLLILGSIKNTGSTPVRSINLEAELFDSNDVFVYECSEYISKKIQPAEEENFQIKCGCGKQPLPEYENIKVNVVSASSY